VELVQGTVVVEGEVARVFNKARQLENIGSFEDAQALYQEIVETEPEFIYGWSNLGNVLTARAQLQEALLCYRKAISLKPPKEALSVILLNKAVVEMSLGSNAAALKDMTLSERLGGSNTNIKVSKAVVLTRLGQWQDGVTIFDSEINTAEKNAAPWWLRYSISLLETSRSAEAVAYLQRVLNRFPEQAECNAFAASLYTSLGNKQNAKQYWNLLSDEDKLKYGDSSFLTSGLFWGPKSVAGMEAFMKTIKR
jgi:tetratricopeptide (TPR) repeat protein